ncbi:MAG: hypothetical protein OXR68_08075 [Alphaproteobacteria bacterium]|nr:hypothetical protein [Alphaproteobacteria bacterium]MDD9920562.1 hypothetical protein [Alphaproteobacteria bacterium]
MAKKLSNSCECAIQNLFSDGTFSENGEQTIFASFVDKNSDKILLIACIELENKEVQAVSLQPEQGATPDDFAPLTGDLLDCTLGKNLVECLENILNIEDSGQPDQVNLHLTFEAKPVLFCYFDEIDAS